MLRFLKKHRKPSKKLAPPENPAHQVADTSAGHDWDSNDINNGGGSRIANQDGRIENQQLPAPNVSTPTSGHEGDNATSQGQDPIRVWNEQLGPNTPDPRPAEKERKERGPSVQQPLETTLELTSGDDQNGGDTHNLIQPVRSRVRERGPIERALGRAALVVDLAKGPAEAFGPLKAVLASVSVIYAKYQSTVAVKDKIEILRSRIAALEKLFEQPASDERETKLREGLSIKLKDIEERLQPFGGKSVPLRYLDSAQDSEDISGLLEDLHEAVSDYMMVQQMAIYKQGCELMDAAEKSALNNFRCANGAEYRHGERKGCLKGTRGAVLNAIELWARDPDKHPVYWLNGLAGTGKSTIAKTIAERLFADGRLGASFFCSRDFKNRRNLHLIFPTLATQLARKYAEFRSILVPLIQSDPELAYESLYNQMKKLIVQPLNESSVSTVIVIDALDECEDEESASAILSVLGRLVSEIPKVKFFLTGRPEPRISEGFRLPLLAKMADVFVLHGVEPDRVDSDIRLFFKSSFSELASRRRGLDNWPTEEQLDRLCERTAGLFVYAAATAKFIDNNKWSPRNQLDTLLQSQKIGDREGRSLDSLYMSILHGAFGNDGPEYDAKTRSVLAAVVLAANPLSPSAIATLLGFDAEDAEDVPPLLTSVHSLLILQQDPNHPVRPFHKSFPDFIIDKTRCSNSRFHISPPDHHAQLLICCLNLMNRVLEKNMCKLPDAVANSDVGDLKERVERYIDPALQYACSSWHAHLIGMGAIPAHLSAITPALHRLLETKFLFWLEVLSVLGAVRNAVEALEVTTDWLEELPKVDLANECLRFVTAYFEIISASSPHIYHSALVVTPKNSIVWKLYESHAHPLTRVVRGAPVSWDSSIAAATRPEELDEVVRSPCDRLIAITWLCAGTVDILDPTTLQRIQTLEPPQGISTLCRALVFSPDSRTLTCTTADREDVPDREIFVVSWDLQTGGVASFIRWRGPTWGVSTIPSITYSANGKMVGASYSRPGYSNGCDIIVYDVASSARLHYHSFNHTVLLSSCIWNHGESLRFATVDPITTTIWEVGPTPGATPMEVEAHPAPPDFDGECEEIELLSIPFRLAFVSRDRTRVLVWDFQDSRCLLECMNDGFCPAMSFSEDGSFFARSSGSDIYLWRESPAGYILHGILQSSTMYPRPLLARNGESIVAYSGYTIQLWRTRRSSILTHVPQCSENNFVLEFSPDGTLAVVAMRGDSEITVLNLKSGTPQLTIDANMGVYGFGVIGNTVVVIGDWKVITWSLPAGDCVPHTCLGPEDSSWTINLGDSRHVSIVHASISPDSRHIVLTDSGVLHIYRVSTGEHLGEVFTDWRHTPRFSLDGCDVWCAGYSGSATVWRVGSGRKVLELLGGVGMDHPQERNPWGSPCGYSVTKDWWILGPDRKRLLLLPPLWQSPYAVLRVWKGRFLALLHGGLSEPVILEFEVNRDL